MARQRKRRRTKVVQLTPEIITRLAEADPEFGEYHARSLKNGMALTSCQTWTRKDGSMTLRAVWRSRTGPANTFSIVYRNRYE